MLSVHTDRKSRPKTDIEDALDMISTGLLMLEQSNLEKVGGRAAIDTAAKLNAQYLTLEKLLKPLKDSIKAKAIGSHTDTIRGVNFKAVIRSFPKSYLNIEKIKKYFGTKLPQYQDTRTETQVTFEIQE